MKCPYRDFKDCIVEKCPSCNYEVVEKTEVCGRAPYWMSDEEAIRIGIRWESISKSYKFVSCKLIDNSVQPIPSTKQIINNTTSTNISIRKSVF